MQFIFSFLPQISHVASKPSQLTNTPYTHKRTQGESIKEDGNDPNKNRQEGKYSSVYRVHNPFSVYTVTHL